MKRNDNAWLLVAFVASILFFARSWEGDLTTDAVRYAAVAKSMVVTNDWLVPQDQPGALYSNKPPLVFWLTALNFKLFGESSFSARFWSEFFALITCLITYRVGRILFGPLAGVLAGCFSATFIGTVQNATELRLDSAVTLASVCALYAVVSAHKNDQARRLLWCGVAAGLGALAKPVAPAHVALITVLFLLLFRREWLFHWSIAGAVILALAIALPWHLAVATDAGPAFAEGYVKREILPRLVPGPHFLRGLGLNIAAVLIYALPWSPVGIGGSIWYYRRAGDDRTYLKFLAVWIVGVLVMMAVPERRFDRYMLPAYPAVALLAAYVFARVLGESALPRVRSAVVGIASAACLALALVPVPLHKVSYWEYDRLRFTLDAITPGTRLSTFDPGNPTSLSTAENQWGIRSATWYYLDRQLDSYATVDEAIENGAYVLLNEEEFDGACIDAGYVKVQSLPKGRSLLVHRNYRVGAEPDPASG